MDFVISKTDRGLVIVRADFSFVLPCEVEGVVRVNLEWTGPLATITNGRFSFDAVSTSDALHWKGSVTPTAAAGRIVYKVPALTTRETAQLCSSGDLKWSAAPNSPGRTGANTAEVRITNTIDAQGHVRTRVTGPAP
jgi:hypothetical protein